MARGQAKLWLIFLFLSCIFYISLRVSAEDTTPKCEKNGTCDCMEMFEVCYAVYLIFVCAFTACKLNLSCYATRIQTTRRMLKQTSRKQEIIFACLFFIDLACLLGGYIKDRNRDECAADNRFVKMSQFASFIIFLSTVQTLILILRSISICQTISRANKRR